MGKLFISKTIAITFLTCLFLYNPQNNVIGQNNVFVTINHSFSNGPCLDQYNAISCLTDEIGFSSGSNHKSRLILMWDLSSIPTNATIINAAVRLKKNFCIGTDNSCGSISLYTSDFFNTLNFNSNTCDVITWDSFGNATLTQTVSESGLAFTFQSDGLKQAVINNFNLNDHILALGFKGYSESSSGVTLGSTTTDKQLIIEYSDVIPPTTPSNLAATGIQYNQFTLNWTQSTDNVGIRGYQVFKNGVFIQEVTSTTFLVTNLQSCTGYSMSIKAVDLSGNLSASANITVNTISNIPEVLELWSDLTSQISYNAEASVSIALTDGFTFTAINNNYLFRARIVTGGCGKIKSSNYIFYEDIPIIEKQPLSTKAYTQIDKVNFNEGSANLYPNPTKGYFRVELTEADQIKKVEVLNSQGMLVDIRENVNSSSCELSVADEADGLFVVRIYPVSGEVINAKVIKSTGSKW